MCAADIRRDPPRLIARPQLDHRTFGPCVVSGNYGDVLDEILANSERASTPGLQLGDSGLVRPGKAGLVAQAGSALPEPGFFLFYQFGLLVLTETAA
jgi:hypothetical protein